MSHCLATEFYLDGIYDTVQVEYRQSSEGLAEERRTGGTVEDWRRSGGLAEQWRTGGAVEDRRSRTILT
ncbi:jg693 [Pararge aegeria aegeria]|uniref:Jg693 protein n=1 Tax=Pararge aegeria aegeria TaxID=348720 RepID=A0A8S4R839_9NEOP|nr:jg693 [Pararge aegeria aegeria]